MRTRFWKVIRELTSSYFKNSMLVIAIGIGIFGMGTILGAYSVIKREMKSNYLGTVPASATIEMEQDIPISLLDSVQAFHGIKEAERMSTTVLRMQVKDKWYPILMFVIDNFKEKKTNKFTHIAGDTEPSTGTMLVERTALPVMEAKEGDTIVIRNSENQIERMRVSGIVHDPALAPAWQEQAGYAYISRSTMQSLDSTYAFRQLRILVDGDQYSKEHIYSIANALAVWLEKNGHDVHEIQIPSPGTHPHQSQMDTIMSLFVVFSFFVLILGVILVATSVSAMMVKQVRQIGVMKTIGGRPSQIASMYFGMIMIICIVSLIVAIPLSRIAATFFFNQLAALLNIEVIDGFIPFWVPIVQVVAGTLIPAIACAFPVVRGSRIPVRDALDNFGINPKTNRATFWMRRLSQIRGRNEVLLLALRNVFRHRSRLTMTLGLLASGGGMFMTALNVSEAWDKNLNQIFVQKLYDVEVRLTNSVDADSIITLAKSLPGVKQVEGVSHWSGSVNTGTSIQVTRTYPDGGHGGFTVLGVTVPTKLLSLKLVEGRWLTDAGNNDVVLNQVARYHFSKVDVGDRIALAFNDDVTEWHVVGFTEDIGSQATAYVSRSRVLANQESSRKISELRVAYVNRSKDNAVRKNLDLEALLEREHMNIGAVIPVWQLHNAVAAHMKILVNSLIAMAVMMGLVGMIGLMSTMSMSTLERTREIGIMRAIGATPQKITLILVLEGLLIGGISFLAAFILSIPLSVYMGRTIGSLSFGTPLTLSISPVALIIWLMVIIIGSCIATIIPSIKTNKMTTREAMTFEY